MRGERRGMAETHRTRPWGRFGHWRRFGAAQRSEGYPPFDDAPPIIGAGVRSRRCAGLRLAPRISTGRPSVLLFRRHVPLWRLR